MKTILIFLVIVNCHAYSRQILSKAGSKKAIIVLTYDDALESQLNIAIPQLDSANLTATFFLDGRAEGQHITAWQGVGKKGYELANHTFYHPCLHAGKTSSKDYTAKIMLTEIKRMNNVLQKIDGKYTRTFAYPCSETAINGKSYTDTLKRSGLIKYARVGGDSTAVITDFKTLDVMQVPSWGVAGNYSGDELIAFVKRVQQSGGLGIFMFHGIGGDYIITSALAHKELLNYLSGHSNEIEVTTFQKAMEIVNHQ